MADDGRDVLALLVEHESAIEQLYQAFAGVFPDRRDLWLTLAEEERGHTDRLNRLRSQPGVDVWFSRDSGLKPQAITSSIRYVESQTARAQVGGLSSVQALAIAKDLEDALIEEQFFRLRDAGRMEVRSVLTGLTEETGRHRDTLADALETERRRLRS